MAVLAIVEQRQPTARLAQVRPPVRANFETGQIVTGVEMRRTLDMTELNFVRRHIAANRRWKFDFEQLSILVPVCRGRKIKAWCHGVERDALGQPARRTEINDKLQRHPQRMPLDHPATFGAGNLPAFFPVENIHVPRVKIVRHIVENHKVISLAGEYFVAGAFVEQAGHVARPVKCGAEELIFEHETTGGFGERDRLIGVGRRRLHGVAHYRRSDNGVSTGNADDFPTRKTKCVDDGDALVAGRQELG